jgi:hypothetical protein
LLAGRFETEVLQGDLSVPHAGVRDRSAHGHEAERTICFDLEQS